MRIATLRRNSKGPEGPLLLPDQLYNSAIFTRIYAAGNTSLSAAIVAVNLL